ncbi:MAG TPA: hypothetical protein VF853_02585 [Candidatus Deferrimicrobiaceae bacterium]
MALYRAGRAADAAAAFDALSAKSPSDDSLKLWKAIAQLEQARQMRDAKADGYKSLIERAYGGLKRLKYREGDNPEWYYALAKAYWLNDRPSKAESMLKKAFHFRPDFPEAVMLQGDMAYQDAVNAPPPSLNAPPSGSAEEWARKVSGYYELVLKAPTLRPDLQAEACYKMGLVESVLRKKPDPAREWWGKAVAAAPDSQYGKLAAEKLGTAGARKNQAAESGRKG